MVELLENWYESQMCSVLFLSVINNTGYFKGVNRGAVLSGIYLLNHLLWGYIILFLVWLFNFPACFICIYAAPLFCASSIIKKSLFLCSSLIRFGGKKTFWMPGQLKVTILKSHFHSNWLKMIMQAFVLF